MFQSYRVKMRRVPYPGVKAYTYRNCSIAVSKENGILTVSIAPHDFEKTPTLPEKEELDGLLTYLGINPEAPYETYTVEHRGAPGYGDTTYFKQAV